MHTIIMNLQSTEILNMINIELWKIFELQKNTIWQIMIWSEKKSFYICILNQFNIWHEISKYESYW